MPRSAFLHVIAEIKLLMILKSAQIQILVTKLALLGQPERYIGVMQKVVCIYKCCSPVKHLAI